MQLGVLSLVVELTTKKYSFKTFEKKSFESKREKRNVKGLPLYLIESNRNKGGKDSRKAGAYAGNLASSGHLLKAGRRMKEQDL